MTTRTDVLPGTVVWGEPGDLYLSYVADFAAPEWALVRQVLGTRWVVVTPFVDRCVRIRPRVWVRWARKVRSWGAC